jgi:hypothetical protein
MARKIYLNVVTKVIVNADEDMSISDIINGLDVEVSSESDGFDVEDYEMEDCQVTESK